MSDEPHSDAPALLSALILAAGLSRRAGPANKLLADIDGRPMVRRVAETAIAAGFAPVVAVTGFEADKVSDALAALPIEIAVNPEFEEGMAASIRAGIRALPAEVAGVLICLGDMPWVSADTLIGLAARFAPAEGRSICRPVYDGRPGNPVLFARRYFPELLDLAGDRGAKAVLQAHVGDVCDCPVDDPGVLRDLDKPQT